MFWTKTEVKYRRVATEENDRLFYKPEECDGGEENGDVCSNEAAHLLSSSGHHHRFAALSQPPPSVSLLFLCVAMATAALLGLVVGITLPSVDIAIMGMSHRSLPLLGARLAVILHTAQTPPPVYLTPMSVSSYSPSPSHASLSEPEPSLSVAPLCPRSLVLPLALNQHGWGVKMRHVVSNALLCNRRLQNRSFFMTEANWNYHSWTAGFLPPAGRLAPLLPGWDEPHINRTEAAWQQLYWPPALSARRLRLTEKRDEGRLATLLHEDGQDLYPASSLSPQPATASAFAFPFDTDCLPPVQRSMQHKSSTAWLDLNVSLPLPHLRGLMEMWDWAWERLGSEIPERALPPDALDFLLLSSPHLFGNSSRRQQLGLALGNPRLSSALLEPGYIQPPYEHYLLSNRIWHQLAVLRPELRVEVRRVLERHSLRSRSQTHEWILAQLQSPRPHASHTPTSASLAGRPFFGLHVRRQDKVEEATPLPASAYVAAVEAVLAKDDQLVASLPAVNCSGRLQPEPVVYIMTDEPQAAAEFPLLRPCWRFVIDPFGSVIPGLTRKNESQWNSLPADDRLQQTRRLLLEATLMSEAEYAIMTGSSNMAMIFMINRGWIDYVWEKRLQLL